MSRAEIIEYVKSVTAMTVRNGPFSGLKLHDVQTWGNGEDIAPQLLGIYEQELHPVLDRFIARRPTAVLNIGCAEGYYAVGIARLLPWARVHAFDIDARAREVCRANAALNEVGEQVSVEVRCLPEDLIRIASVHSNILAVIDCEGDEVDLFGSPTSIEALKLADILIETHFRDNADTAERLFPCFFASHRVSIVRAGARDPHAFPFLDSFADLDKWMLVCENRPRLQTWLVCESRQAVANFSP